MYRSNTKSATLGRWVITTAIVGLAGCGGGEEAPAPDAAATAEAPKAGPPTVKGLGAQAKERQGDMDSQASGGAAPAAPASDPQAEARRSMMAAQGGPPGGRPGETEGPPASGPGAAAPSAAGGGYVPGYAQGGSQGGSQGGPGGPGGGPPPGVAFGAAPGPGGQAAGMMPPGAYGAPGSGIPGGMPGGGAGGAVLLAETAFLENGEALNDRVEGPGGPQGQPGEPGFGAQGGAGGALTENDFSEPTKAVESFLSAAKARDGERIGQAISRRAPGEAKAAGLKRVMTSAVDRKLSDEDIANIAETFADYQVMNITPGKTSGSVNVTIGRERKGTGKTERTTFERRIMRVHRDGNTGFKILDFGNRIVND